MTVYNLAHAWSLESLGGIGWNGAGQIDLKEERKKPKSEND